MFRLSRDARRLAGASTVALAALAAAGSSAQAAQATLTYQCAYPLIGTQPLTLAIDAGIPDTWGVGQRTPAFPITAIATPGADTASGLNFLLVKSLEGSATATALLTAPGPLAGGLPLKIPITVQKYDIPSSGALALTATGSTPPLTFTKPGIATVNMSALTLNLTARNAAGDPIQVPPIEGATDSDGNPDTFDVNCTPVEGQSPLVSTITLTDGTETPDTQAPTVPGGVKATPASARTATVSWSSSTDNTGVLSYLIYNNGKLAQTVQGANSTTIGGLEPSTSYAFTVKARDAAGNVSDASGTARVTTPASTETGTLFNIHLDLGGSATLKTLTTGALPLTGGIDATANLKTNQFTGPLTLNDTVGKLKLVGFLPATARVGFAPTGPATGTLKDGYMVANINEIVKLPKIYILGIQVAGAGGCRTRYPSAITLKSTGAPFNPLKVGGSLVGNFNLSELVDCGALTGVISPLAKGGPNSIAVNLTPSS